VNIEELLPAYVAGELSEEDSERVEAALARSSRLRAELSRYERLLSCSRRPPPRRLGFLPSCGHA